MRWLGSASLSYPARILGVVLALTLLLSGAGAGMQFAHANAGTDANAPSVAGPNDGVIAHGVAVLPPGQIAWQVVQATAPPLGEGTAKPRMLGFPLAIHDAILITDQATGQQTRLAQWEAAFTPSGAMQRRESLASGPVTYDQIAPVPADQARSTSGSSLLFAGDPFTAPTSRRDLDLVKGHLFPGNTSEKLTTDPGAPLVVLVLQGSLSISTDQGTNATLLVGQAGSYSGTVTLTTQDTSAAGTTFVAGIIGPAIPAQAATPPIVPATEQATAASQTGSIAILARHCMAQAGTGDAQPTSTPLNACIPYPNNWDIKLTGPNGSTYTLADAQIQQVTGMATVPAGSPPIAVNAYVWSNLPLGTYTFSASDVTMPSDISSFVAYFDDLPNDPFSIQTSNGYAIPLTSDQPDRKVTIAFGAPPNESTPVTEPTSTGGGLTLELTISACPPGDSLSGGRGGFAGSFCRKPDGSEEAGKLMKFAHVGLINVSTGTTVAGQTDEHGAITFNNLPADTYRVGVTGALQAQSFCGGPGAPAAGYGDIFNPSGIALPANSHVVCSGDILTTLSGGNTGTSNVSVAACTGIDPDHATTEQLTTDCQKQLDGVTIHLEGQAYDLPQQTAGGQTTWSNVNPGPITLREEIPAGYAAPAIDCSYKGPNGNGLFGAKSDAKGTISHNLQAGEHLTCTFYHAASSATTPTATADGAGEIIVAVYGCPAGTSNPSPAACPLLFSGYGFRLQSLTDKSAPILSLADATASQDGDHSWSGLSFGSYDLVESLLPSGYSDYVAPGFDRIQGTAMTGLKVTISANAPYAVVNIFDLSSEPPATAPPASTAPQTTSLTVRIFNCPPGNSGNPNDDVTSCTPPTSEVAAILTTPNGKTLALSDGTVIGPGVWRFDGLAAGTGYTVQEDPLPAGYAGDTVWLLQSHGYMVQITGSFGLVQTGGNRIDIYNIQPSATSTSTPTVPTTTAGVIHNVSEPAAATPTS